MAKKRKSSEIEPQVEATADMADASGHSNDRTVQLERSFNNLCRAARLGVSVDGSNSPTRGLQEKEAKLWSAYKFLSWKNPSQLSEEVNDYLAGLALAPAHHSRNTRFNFLLDRLTECVIATPKTTRFTKLAKTDQEMPTIVEPTQPCSTNDYLEGPPSPTPTSPRVAVEVTAAQSHLRSSFKTTKPGASRSPALAKSVVEISRPDLDRRGAGRSPSATKPVTRLVERKQEGREDLNGNAISNHTSLIEKARTIDSPPITPVKVSTTSSNKNQRQTTLSFGVVPKQPIFREPAPAPPPSVEPLVSHSNINGNDTTSFTSTAANTSFGKNTSFWSSQATQKSAQTDATSFSDMPPPARPVPRDSTEYGSSLSSTTAEKWLEACRQYDLSARPIISTRTSDQSDFTGRGEHELRPVFQNLSSDSELVNNHRGPTSPDKQHMSRLRRGLDSQESEYGSSIGASALDALEGYRNAKPGAIDYEMSDAPKLLAIPEETATHTQGSPKRQPQVPVMQFEPTSSFAQLKLPKGLDDVPLIVLWEAQRVLQTGHLSSADLAHKWRPRSLQTLYELAASLGKPFEKGFDTEEAINLEKITFGAGLQYSQSGSGPIFDLVLYPPKLDKSCDLQRRYGAERVLYVDIPSMSKPPQLHQGRDVMARFSEMAMQPQRFLGQRWILYMVQRNKQTKNSAVGGSSRLVFFAVNDGLVKSLFDDIIPYRENSHQPARKLYTRLELSLSRTIAAFEFLPEDIDFKADDQCATLHRDDNAFLDPDLQDAKWKVDPEHNFNPKKEMSDGCAALSSWAYWQAHKAMGMENVRSAFQARIGGAKGVWYKDREDFTGMDEQKPPGKHIKLAKTQVKVNRDTLAGCDSFTLSLNVVKFNSYATTSLLHTGFMPILLDRGVPEQVMLDVIRTQVRRETDEIEDAIKGGSETLRRWIASQNGLFEERNRDGGHEIVIRPDGLPLSREERIVQLLEAGFEPNELPYLAREVILMAQQSFDLKKKNYKIKLGRSTTLMGIADPFGCLEPGEVHVNFSTPFLDFNGMSWLRLNMDGLIARNPALAPWDIQKVKFVCKPELEHLPDLFIFPTKGRRPLAGMLQGGDYDGDTFWGCWEPKFTRFFKNAPCPWEAPKEEFFNIKKRKETLQHYVGDPDSEREWCRWLGEMAVARLGMNLLGVVTKLHERLIYRTGDLKSYAALQLVHLHDYLVDADKQGYDFGFDAFNEFKKKIKLPPSLPDPAYWELLKGESTWNDYENEPDNYPVDKTKVSGNIIDEAYFGVVQPTITASLDRVTTLLSIKEKEDADLTKFWKQMLEASAANPVIAKALRELKVDLEQVRKFWGMNYKKHEFEDLIKLVRNEYEKVQPHDLHEPIIIEWLRRCGNDLIMWDRLKASALAKFQHHATQPGKFIFSIAGGELCRLKLSEMGATRGICMNQYRMLKLRKERKVELRDDYIEERDPVADVEDEELGIDTAYY